MFPDRMGDEQILWSLAIKAPPLGDCPFLRTRLLLLQRRTGELTTVVGDFRFPEQHKWQQPIHRRYFAFHDPSVYKRDDVMGDSGSLPRLEACLSSTINP
ncbi:hypothetical protein HZH68_010352 [Vespula germanica]|uniref:Uncharacterized protein n=1 Tax=Vespula germanica TaxID=30212 RepID=A0A834JRL3_VESGE|nr:hypothetical protein HZH68_010352 [Vespula germanica]